MTTLAHLARRTLEMPPPRPLLLLLYFSLPLYISFPRFLPPLPIALPSLPPSPPPPSPLPRSRLPSPAAAHTARYASSLSLCSPSTPTPPLRSPLLNRALFTLAVSATTERGAALLRRILFGVRCVDVHGGVRLTLARTVPRGTSRVSAAQSVIANRKFRVRVRFRRVSHLRPSRDEQRNTVPSCRVEREPFSISRPSGHAVDPDDDVACVPTKPTTRR